MTTAFLAVCLSLPHPAQARSVDVRIGWLLGRVAHHRYVCRHGHRATRVFACKALRWTKRELREARAEKHLRDWGWQAWLPDKFRRVAHCETGLRWDWDSGTYVSAYGIIRPAYDSFARQLGFAPWNGRNTPREQTRVADAIRRAYSWSAWGCGGA